MIPKQIITFLKSSTIAIACTAMLLPANATTVYKYIGDFGEVKYSQFPPTDGREVEVIELRSNRQTTLGQYAGKTTTDATAANEDTTETEEQQRIAALEAKVKEQEAQQMAERCANLRSSLANLSTGGRLYVPDENGGKKYLDDREAELERERVQNLLGSYCNGQAT